MSDEKRETAPEVNEDFITAMQAQLYKKKDFYVGERHYKNMSIMDIRNRLVDMVVKFRNAWMFKVIQDQRRFLVHIGNFCWMLWERLGELDDRKEDNPKSG